MVDHCVKMIDYVILVSVDDVFLDGVSKEGVLVFLAYKLLQSSNLYQGLRIDRPKICHAMKHKIQKIASS